MGVSSGSHFQIKTRTGLYPKSENSSVRHRLRPKPQINYSNQQYHLLIANKHKKILTYCLFEGLIEDLEEWK